MESFFTSVCNQKIELKSSGIQLFIKREDAIHPQISGNKFRKLKYNLEQAMINGTKQLLTFGGAYSNHIAATAYAGKLYGFKTIGVIRGDELKSQLVTNPTLSYAQSCGMTLHFVNRERYKAKMETAFLSRLKAHFGSFYLIPEGGTNNLAVKGCEEILTETDSDFDIICCSVGTGGTLSGLINTSKSHQKVIGFPALKGDFLKKDICKFALQKNWELICDYHFGGYGKIKPELITFINTFKEIYGVPLDPVYTGKMMFGIMDLINKGFFLKESKILAIHTGGLQGIKGMNQVLKRRNLSLINE